MNNTELIALVDRLRREPREVEWLEFKENWHEPQVIGEYLSALSNSACLAGRPRGYLVFGIDNATHDVVGTSVDPYRRKGKGNQGLLMWLGTGLQPNVGFESHVVQHPDGRVVVFEVHAAWDRPVHFSNVAYIRVGSSKTELRKHPEKERSIWTRRTDWSAQICEAATLADLDPEALLKAREQFAVKYPAQAGQLATWEDSTFLSKAKLTKHRAMTNAAILLLGRPEAAALIDPAVARISWILKDERNQELDYEHFDPPFILQVDRFLQRIRNLTLRSLPSGTLFPQEVTQYDPWVIREALHNCIAHQDYGLRGRINAVETPHSLLLTNVGSFLPGDVESVIRQDAPLEIYRNTFLAQAMVNLNMIDTQGGGIKRMFQAQLRRFMPLPDYDLSAPERVAVTIQGRILDERYTRLLMERSDLDLWLVVLLDRVQKRVPISREEHRVLKDAGLVEGRYPNLLVGGRVAEITGQKARHIRERGFAKRYYTDLVLALLREHGPVGRDEIDRLLLDKLPDVLTEQQKKSRVHHILSGLRQTGMIRNTGTRSRPRWEMLDPGPEMTKESAS